MFAGVDKSRGVFVMRSLTFEVPTRFLVAHENGGQDRKGVTVGLAAQEHSLA